MPSTWSNTLDTASTFISSSATFTRTCFGAAKTYTKLGFSIVRSVAGFAPVPLLDAILTYLEKLSLLSILFFEFLVSSSLVVASTSLDFISNVISVQYETSIFLLAFFSLIRRKLAEQVAQSPSVTDVAKALAAWAAIQGFTNQWSEDRWFKSLRELKRQDFQPLENPQTQPSRPRATRRVSITEDVITAGRSAQVVSADIGQKDDMILNNTSSETPFAHSSPRSSPLSHRSNYQIRKTLRRLSKMVLVGYGGATLLWHGLPLQPDPSPTPQRLTNNEISRTDMEVKNSEEDVLLHVVGDAESHTALRSTHSITPREEKHTTATAHIKSERNITTSAPAYSWWNVLLGKHDREIFEGFAVTQADDEDSSVRSPFTLSSPHSSPKLSRLQSFSRRIYKNHPQNQREVRRSTTMLCDVDKMPRFWVLTDHGRRQVVLVVRGTMTHHDLAVDLQCESVPFEPATAISPTISRPPTDTRNTHAGQTYDVYSRPPTPNTSATTHLAMDSGPESMPGNFMSSHSDVVNQTDTPRPRLKCRTSIFDQIDGSSSKWPPWNEGDNNGSPRYQVHGGILELARAMGSEGKPVHDAIRTALVRNPDYKLVMCGHSLGAGVASMLALMWADPTTCLTVPSSGLPSNHHVSVYCFAPPCIMTPALSRLCDNLIMSIVYSFDFASRLSLGSILELLVVAHRLCGAQGEENAANVLRRALKGTIGEDKIDTKDTTEWFVKLRKALDDKLRFTKHFPPGRIWWAIRNEALHPSHQAGKSFGKGVRLYEVERVEEVFGQIELRGDMFSSHSPIQYDRLLAELSDEDDGPMYVCPIFQKPLEPPLKKKHSP